MSGGSGWRDTRPLDRLDGLYYKIHRRLGEKRDHERPLVKRGLGK